MVNKLSVFYYFIKQNAEKGILYFQDLTEVRKRLIAVLLILISFGVYTHTYLSHTALPGASSEYPIGWWGWCDQGKYLSSAKALSEFDFKKESHWYPIGYPFLGALFYKISPIHPFFIPNAICFLLINWLLFKIYQSFLSSFESIILIVISIYSYEFIFEQFIISWNTIPVHALIYSIIYLLLFSKKNQTYRFTISSVFAGVIFLFRPGDLLFVFPIFMACLFPIQDVKKVVKICLISTSIVLLFIITGLAINKLIFNSYWDSPYHNSVGNVGFTITNLFYRIYSIFVESKSIYLWSDDKMLIERYPWIVLALPGMVFAIQKYGFPIIGIIISIIISFLFYGSYNDFGPFNIFRYACFHYLIWLFPFLLLFSYLTVRYAWKNISITLFIGLLVFSVISVYFIGIERNYTLHVAENISSNGENRIKAHFDSSQNFMGIFLPEWSIDINGNPNLRFDDGKILYSNSGYKLIQNSNGVLIVLNKPIDSKTITIIPVKYQQAIQSNMLVIMQYNFSFGGKALTSWKNYTLTAERQEQVNAVTIGTVEDMTGPWAKCNIPDYE